MARDDRVHVSFRLGPVGKEWIDNLAHRLRTDRSEVLRQALAVAKKHETELIKRLEENS